MRHGQGKKRPIHPRDLQLLDWPPDSDGSAKVALIGVDRCLAAWEVVRKLLPEHAAMALDFMLRLDRLRTKVETQFPNARNFIRPGFDDCGS
ncbi:MAG TPA: hypothetical protein VGH65_05465 [Verrucomicrobiaceae bacterium]|jgi:hypothetical protein